VSALHPAPAGAPPRVAITILDPRERAGREGYVEGLRPDGGGGVVVTLLLDDGTPGAVSLDAGDAEWLELREGDIVGVAVGA
jgi:hypothetical protein